MTNSFAEMDSMQRPALCCHYFSTHFEDLRVQVLGNAGASTEMMVSWAVGVLPDGDWELLGVWSGVSFGPVFWRSVWDDLDGRGVGKISWVCASDPDARAMYSAVRVLPPFRSALCATHVPPWSSVGVLRAEARRLVREASGVRAARRSLERVLLRAEAGQALVLSPDWPVVLEQLRPFYALPPHRRAVVSQGDEHLEQLDLCVRRAVGRHGPFADLPSAAQFVAWTLSRAQMRVRFPHWPAHWFAHGASPRTSHSARQAGHGVSGLGMDVAHVVSPGL